MNIATSIRIERPIDQVWKIVADDFAEVQQWIGSVRKSTALTDTPKPDGAPVAGRFCVLSDKPDGLCARETITGYDNRAWKLDFEVVPVNGGALFPVKSNRVSVSLTRAGSGATDVTWTAVPDLKPHGYVMYPMLKMGLGKAFGGILQDLKTFAEAD